MMADDYSYSIMLRVFFETADGGYYSPRFDKCFELLPVPEFIGRFRKRDIASRFNYRRIPCRCGKCRLDKYLPNDYLLVGGSSYSVSEIIAHWDPRLDIGVYSDYWRAASGRIPKEFRECRRNCYIFFAAGLARYPKHFFARRRGFTEIRRTFMRSERGIYVTAYMQVDEIIDLTKIASERGIDIGREGDDRVWEIVLKEYGERAVMTPHYARGGDLPVIILSDEGNYAYLDNPIPIMEWVNGRKRLSRYSYTFQVRGFEDRVRHKLFSPKRTEEIIRLIFREGFRSR